MDGIDSGQERRSRIRSAGGDGLVGHGASSV